MSDCETEDIPLSDCLIDKVSKLQAGSKRSSAGLEK